VPTLEQRKKGDGGAEMCRESNLINVVNLKYCVVGTLVLALIPLPDGNRCAPVSAGACSQAL
jgi:hypothetical protein